MRPFYRPWGLQNGIIATGPYRVVLGFRFDGAERPQTSYVNGNVERLFSSPGLPGVSRR